MSRLPETRRPSEPGPPREERPPAPWLAPLPRFFLSISRTEVRLHNGQAHLKAERHQVEDGRVVTERMEGQVGPEMYYNMVQQAEQQMRGMLDLMQQQMKLFMPWLSGKRR